MRLQDTAFYLLVATWIATFSGCSDFRDCSPVDTTAAEQLPQTLLQTGLYEDLDNLSATALEFTPRFGLWTDGASKRRWLMLPPNGQVDTSAPDDWRFPVGTKLFKEFTRDGVRVETRMSLRTPTEWTAVSYIWNAEGTEALRAPEGLDNGLGTPHDVPDAGQCMACHGGRGSFVLGFAAVQLDLETRRSMFEQGVLSEPVELEPSVDAAAIAGLGVLHANCSHCHNEDRDAQPQATSCFSPNNRLDFTLPVGLERLADAPAMRTARDELGSPGESQVINRMSQRNQSNDRPSMPPLGTEIPDVEGIETVTMLIQALPPER